MIMSVPGLVTITVTLIRPVPTHLVALPVPVTRATVGMDAPVLVSSGLCSSDSLEFFLYRY